MRIRGPGFAGPKSSINLSINPVEFLSTALTLLSGSIFK